MEEIGQKIIEVIVNHTGEVIVFIGTSIAALIKRKIDLRKIKRAEKKRLKSE